MPKEAISAIRGARVCMIYLFVYMSEQGRAIAECSIIIEKKKNKNNPPFFSRHRDNQRFE